MAINRLSDGQNAAAILILSYNSFEVNQSLLSPRILMMTRTDVIKDQSKREEFYQYGNNDGYFTLLVSAYYTFIDPMTMEEVDSIDVTKNGELLK